LIKSRSGNLTVRLKSWLVKDEKNAGGVSAEAPPVWGRAPRDASATHCVGGKFIVNALERDFVDAVKSAVPEVARTSASWIRGSVYLQFIVCSSYGTEKIKLHIKEEAVRHYVNLNSRMRFFARRRIKEYVA